MTGFQTVVSGDISLHSGDPDCDAAHAALLNVLVKLGTPFIGPTETISLSQQGNLGEFISFHIAQKLYPPTTHRLFSGNALKPLSRISGAGLDLVYLYFDTVDPSKDLMYVQEIKTTIASNLNYFDQLKADYKKLFAIDPNLTLHSRVQDIQNILEYQFGEFSYSTRIAALAGVTPAKCAKVRLLPTGISSTGVGDPEKKLTAIRSSMTAWGWPQANIKPWSIVMSDLDDRLTRMARGLP